MKTVRVALRYDEENCNAQCAYPCNRARNRAVKEAYELGLVRKYGEDVLNRLWDKRKQTKCYSVAELEKLTILYRNKFKTYEKNRTTVRRAHEATP